VVVPVCVAVAVPDAVDGVGVGDGERLGVRLGVGLVDSLADGLALGLVFLADGDGLAVRVALVAVGFAVAVCFGVAVAVGLGFAEVAGLDTRLWVGLGRWVSRRVGLLDDVVALAVGVGVADGNASGSHDAPLTVEAAPAAAVPAAMARVTPEAAVARTVPAIRVTVAGRACAKRMKRPTCAARYCCGTTRSVGVWLHEACCAT
jgi:hypothetical protein